MANLKIYNEKILNNFYRLEYQNEYSYPLLVSPKLKKYDPKIMYIGQETNTWLKDKNEKVTQEELEDTYYYFLKNGLPSSLFWKFIKKSFDLKEEVYKNIIWCNSIICGKKNEKGTPMLSCEMMEISIDYLIYLYHEFNPDYIVIVAGPNDPYYFIIKTFLSCIKKENLASPTRKNVFVLNDSIFWTYHPNYLNRIGKIDETIKELNKVRKK